VTREAVRSIVLIFLIRGSTSTCVFESYINNIKAFLATKVMTSDILYCSTQDVVISFVLAPIANIAVACSAGGKETRSCFFCVISTLAMQTLSSSVYTSGGVRIWVHKEKPQSNMKEKYSTLRWRSWRVTWVELIICWN